MLLVIFESSETGRQITGILDRFMSLGYDKRVRPNYGGPPVEVNVTMRILSISSVSEVMMDFTADFYFRQTWHDPRLSFKKLGDIQTLYVGAEVSKKIWLPDTFFGNEKLVSFIWDVMVASMNIAATPASDAQRVLFVRESSFPCCLQAANNLAI